MSDYYEYFVFQCAHVFPTQLSTAMSQSIMQRITQRKTSKRTPADGYNGCMMWPASYLHVNTDQFCFVTLSSFFKILTQHTFHSLSVWERYGFYYVGSKLGLLRHVSYFVQYYMDRLHYGVTQLNNKNINKLPLWIFGRWFDDIDPNNWTNNWTLITGNNV